MHTISPSTETIRAAHDLTIQYDESAWRLYHGLPGAGAPGDVPVLLDARPDKITCARSFALARNLPLNGRLTPADVAQVVVGWAAESRTWNLGLLLAAKPESGFKSTWCGLASWPTGPAHESAQAAHQAGHALARLLNRPLHLVPAPDAAPRVTGETQAVESTVRMSPVDVARVPSAAPAQPTVPEIPVNRPPFEFEDWVMREGARGFVWQRRNRWVVGTLLRAGMLFVFAILFVLLGVGTQSRGLAQVEPTWLPWLGLTVAVVLLGLAAWAIWSLLSTRDVIVDMTRREVRCQDRWGGRTVWRVPFDRLDYVLVSQTPLRPQGRTTGQRQIKTQQAVWLHLSNGERFWQVVALKEIEGTCHNWERVKHTYTTTGRRPLKLAHYDTPAHHAARVMARAIGADVWLDIR